MVSVHAPNSRPTPAIVNDQLAVRSLGWMWRVRTPARMPYREDPILRSACTNSRPLLYHTCMETQARTPTDEQLARQALTDREAFGMLVERYEQRLTAYAARLAGRQEAEDVVQQAFLQAYRNLAGFDPHLTFSAWMYRIVHNTAVNAVRKHHNELPTELELDGETVELLTSSTDLSADAVRADTELSIRRSLARLDGRSRDVLLLSLVEGRSYSEIADILMMSVNSVGPTLTRAKERLRHLVIQTSAPTGAKESRRG
jgi:RNA polymerase sigma-70 factor (ECF subfamily)